MNWHVMQRQHQPLTTRGTSSSTSIRRNTAVVAAMFVSGLFSACSGGGSAALAGTENVGALTGQPDTEIGSAYFLGDSHFGGEASNLNVKSMHWGRLVNVTAKGPDVVLRDFVIAPNVKEGTTFTPSSGATITYHLSRNPITDQYTLRIGAKENTGDVVNEVTPGSTRFIEALQNLETHLTPIFDKSLDANEVGPFSMIPRNAAVVVLFSDLLEPVYDNGGWHDSSAGDVVNTASGQLNKNLVKIRTGYPPVTPYETRVILDPNHGNVADRDGDGVAEFYSTRVIVSSTVSSIEAQLSDPPLAINSIGLPESLVPDDTNLAFRIPTFVNAALGQPQVLRNASGRVINFDSNGSNDPVSGTRDIVRALRSGGGLTQDPNNGFLLDDDAPALIGDQSVVLGSLDSSYPGCTNCTEMDIEFDVALCESIKVDDIITQSTSSGQVNGLVLGWDDGGSFVTVPPSVGRNLNVVVQLLGTNSAAVFTGASARVGTQYASTDVAECFVRFSPPAGTSPASDVEPTAAAFLLFSEPMDPTTIGAYDSFTITREGAPEDGLQFSTGRVVSTADLRTFRWEHNGVPFNHDSSSSSDLDVFTVTLAAGEEGPTDLAGNPLALSLDPFNFSLRPGAPVQEVRSFTFRFEKPADDLFNDDIPEIRDNQIIFDVENQRLLPRPITRFSASADTSSPLPGNMTIFAGGVQTPLSNLGSKLQTLWRYPDVGFSVSDETNFNVDVEGISWSPVGGAVSSDIYDAFSVAVTHSLWLPDEVLDMNSGFPKWPASGVKPAYANNPADLIEDPFKTLHTKELGYIVSSQNLYTASSGTPMMPFPVNEEVALEDRSYYTWRDTALLFLAGGVSSLNQTGNGAPLDSEIDVLGLDGTKTYLRGEVPTVGLPLLMEFRCYPSNEALGLNAFDIALASNTSIRPNFRSFSTGGYTGSVAHLVDPDNSDTATGGYNPTSNPPGMVTPGTDNTFYYGELALVTRVSRVHSVLLDTGSDGPTTFAQPSIEPEANSQPAGTFVNLAYRGVSDQQVPMDIVAGATGGSSSNLTPYGNRKLQSNFTYLDTTGAWKDDITELVGARYFQFRVSFISNAATERTAELRTLAFPYFKN